MKNTQNTTAMGMDIFSQVLEGTALAEQGALDIAVNNSVCIIHKAQMTALEVAEVIATLTDIASDLTVMLSTACGFCDNCGEQRDAAPNSRTTPDDNPFCTARDGSYSEAQCSEACAFLNGCKDTPADWVRHCDLCQSLLDKTEEIQIPDYLREEAGIPMNAKLTAFSDDEGEIVIMEADYQQDISDVPESVVAILAAAGICLAELDELVMQEEIIYGK